MIKKSLVAAMALGASMYGNTLIRDDNPIGSMDKFTSQENSTNIVSFKFRRFTVDSVEEMVEAFNLKNGVLKISYDGKECFRKNSIPKTDQEFSDNLKRKIVETPKGKALGLNVFRDHPISNFYFYLDRLDSNDDGIINGLSVQLYHEFQYHKACSDAKIDYYRARAK